MTSRTLTWMNNLMLLGQEEIDIFFFPRKMKASNLGDEVNNTRWIAYVILTEQSLNYLTWKMTGTYKKLQDIISQLPRPCLNNPWNISSRQWIKRPCRWSWSPIDQFTERRIKTGRNYSAATRFISIHYSSITPSFLVLERTQVKNKDVHW